MCQEISTVEWSGVLFYSVKGSITDFANMELIAEDILPMDKGTTGSTGYELGDEIIDYRMNNMESLSWKMGMIHSHHNMDSYFSGTDMDELDDNTEFHNYYLSLVVNNRGKMVAKVAFRGEIPDYNCKDESGNIWNLKLKEKKQVMFTFDCKIKAPRVSVKVPKEFAERTLEVIAESDKKALTTKHAVQQLQNRRTSYLPKTTTGGGKSWQKNAKQHQQVREFYDGFEDFDDFEDVSDMSDWNASFKPETNYEEDTEKVKDFLRYLLRIGDTIKVEKDTLEAALEDTELLNKKEKFEYVQKFLTVYPALFEKYWGVFGEINMEKFMEISTQVVDILIEYEDAIAISKKLVGGLDSMLEKM